MELTCYVVGKKDIEVQPARPRRTWMDETPMAFVYKCLPLVVANTHGWEVLSPLSFEAEWNGGVGLDAVEVVVDEEHLRPPYPASPMVKSHFGSGVLTFVPDVIIQTPPGYDLWIGGSPNEFKDGIQAMSAVIEADWMPFTFTMNWKFTRPGWRVRFERGEPYCFIFPVRRGAVEECEPVIRPMERGSEMDRMYRHAYARRLKLRGKEVPGVEVEGVDVKHNNWYAKGVLPDLSGSFEEHRRRIRAKPFQRQEG